MGHIDELTSLVPAQDDRILVDWEAVTAQWGVTFPDDFREISEIFGSGELCDYLLLAAPNVVPGSGAVDLEMFTPRAEQLEMAEAPFPAHPDPGGLVGWGVTPDGDSVFLRTPETDRGEWSIVVFRRHPNRNVSHWHEYDMGPAEFLTSTLTGSMAHNPFSGSDLYACPFPAFRRV